MKGSSSMAHPLLFSGDRDWTGMQAAVHNSVVQVMAQVAEFNWVEPYRVHEQRESRGSGFFIDLDGHIVTNAHVVDEAKKIWIHVPYFGRKPIHVDIVSFCPDRDLALLKIKDDDLAFVKAGLGSLFALPFGDSDLVQRTEPVMILGYPLGQYRMKSATGVVSGRESGGGRSLIQITAPVNPGNSGGPLLNIAGQVIGITIATAWQAQNIGYAIPINELKIVLDDLYTIPFVRRGSLGVGFNYSTDSLSTFLGNPTPPGLYVNRVLKGSFLEKMGVQEGDMLYEFNTVRIDAFGEISVPWSSDKILIHDLVARLRVGDLVKIMLYRRGKRHNVTGRFEIVTPYPIRQMHPDYEQIDYELIGGMVIMQLVDNHFPIFFPKVPFLVNYAKPEKKVDPILIITHILPGSITQQQRSLMPGYIIVQVNEKPVCTLKQFRAALQESVASDLLVIKTLDNVFVVLPFKTLLKDEERLSRDFSYSMTKMIRELLNT